MHVCVRSDIHVKAYRTWKAGNLVKSGSIFASDGIGEHFRTASHASDNMQYAPLITMVNALNSNLHIADKQFGSIEFKDFLCVALQTFKGTSTKKAMEIWDNLVGRKKIKQTKTKTANVALTVNQIYTMTSHS